MKLLIIFTNVQLLLSLYTSILDICNKDLLFSYGINKPNYVQKTSMLCGGVEEESCCRNFDES